MEIAELRRLVELRHADLGGRGTFAVRTGRLLALLAVAEAAEEALSNKFRDYYGTDWTLNEWHVDALAAALTALKEAE